MFFPSSICLLDCSLTLAYFPASATEGKLIFHLFRKYSLLSLVLLPHLLLCDKLKSLMVSLFQLITLYHRLYFNLIAIYCMVCKLEWEEQKDKGIFPLPTIPLSLCKHTSSVLTCYWWQCLNQIPHLHSLLHESHASILVFTTSKHKSINRISSPVLEGNR